MTDCGNPDCLGGFIRIDDDRGYKCPKCGLVAEGENTEEEQE